MLTEYIQRVANELRAVRPTKAAQRRNPGIDVTKVWLDDIEHTIRCQQLDAEQAAEFRAVVMAL